MDAVIRVKILKEASCILIHSNAFRKAIYQWINSMALLPLREIRVG